MPRFVVACALVASLASSCADESVAVTSEQELERDGEPAQLPPSPELVEDNAEPEAPPSSRLEGPVTVTVVEPGTEPRHRPTLVNLASPWTVVVVTTLRKTQDGMEHTVPLRMVVHTNRADESSSDVAFRMGTVELVGGLGDQVLDRGLRNGLRQIARIRGTISDDGTVRLDEPVVGQAHWTVRACNVELQRSLRWVVGPSVDTPLGVGGRWNADVIAPTGESALGGARYTVLAGDSTVEKASEADDGAPNDKSTAESAASFRIVPWVAEEDSSTAIHLSVGTLAQVSDRFALTGPAVQGGMVFGTTVVGAEVYFHRRRLPVGKAGEFVVAFGRNARSPAHLVLRFPDGTRSEHVFELEQREYETEAIDGLPEAMVHPSREVLAELRRVDQRIERVRQTVSEHSWFDDGFHWPVKGRVTSTYGRKRVLNGVPKGYHWGIDIAAPVGRVVKAPAPGVVVFAEKDVPLSGNIVILDHGLGVTSSFLHLDRIQVKVGDEVQRGDKIGKVGATGRATGPHLDWRMNVLNTRVDPGLLVGVGP